jgi:hypothetical protein
MRLCNRCGYWLAIFGGRCEQCGQNHPCFQANANVSRATCERSVVCRHSRRLESLLATHK